MEGKGKLSRTPSSLLRSPSISKSSYQSLVSLDEHYPFEKKPQRPPQPTIRAPPSVLPLLFPLLFLLSLLLFYLRDETPALGSLLLASAGLAVASVILQRSRLCGRRARRSESVQWFIGDDGERVLRRGGSCKDAIVREGVEFYSNGDCYEGEFNKGSCNGSGVYNFFAKGRYEGEWVDGKYDGYGMESWAKGSRYRGQYRQGLRHGFGVYRFYNGDSYAGEWVSGQSHGTGVQSCSDGSCYSGQFKRGVKHGVGCYSFR